MCMALSWPSQPPLGQHSAASLSSEATENARSSLAILQAACLDMSASLASSKGSWWPFTCPRRGLVTAADAVQHCNPQNLANMLWAYATLEVQPGPELTTAATRRMLELLPESKPQALANLAWAFATLGCNPGMALCCCLVAWGLPAWAGRWPQPGDCCWETAACMGLPTAGEGMQHGWLRMLAKPTVLPETSGNCSKGDVGVPAWVTASHWARLADGATSMLVQPAALTLLPHRACPAVTASGARGSLPGGLRPAARLGAPLGLCQDGPQPGVCPPGGCSRSSPGSHAPLQPPEHGQHPLGLCHPGDPSRGCASGCCCRAPAPADPGAFWPPLTAHWVTKPRPQRRSSAHCASPSALASVLACLVVLAQHAAPAAGAQLPGPVQLSVGICPVAP